ncbi:amidohydrolase [Leucobacter chromiireducens]|uniref:Peptidase M20 domain-containing protein 2 n=1 Tax=Leucobacter chromiireducens subsp. solipictus TaxID=398235 RepID=A0ABS1SC28_9MICO|nr:amidohydrolase [Leucobacter chromiireducens]MBL3678098.1 amidohydrolase [Leucobacter chromiireducens subsp. solipictus]
MTTLSPAQQRAAQSIRDAEAALLGLSHAIGADPELGFAEHRAAARVAAELDRAGFAVETGAYGLPTAIEAVFGSGDVTITVVGEYDALPGVGHACGHNIIAAAGVGAALGLRAVADELGCRIQFLGTPAEENGGGKVIMLERGAWDRSTFSLMVHAAGRGQIRTAGGSSQALDYCEATFRGKPAHAAFAPQEGINAGSAVTLTEVGIGLLRQHLPSDAIISSVSTTPSAVNVIPETATIQLEVRGNHADTWAVTKERVRQVVAGAALAAGCEVDIAVPTPGYAPLVQDPELAEFFDTALAELRGDDAADWGPGMTLGSTDMGDVSQYLPSIHPMIALDGTDATPHQHEFTAAAVSELGDTAVMHGALALARAAIAAVETDAVRERLRAQQRDRAPYPRGVWTDAPVPGDAAPAASAG